MLIEEAVRVLLLADPGFLALAGDRLYPQDAPQESATPCVIYASSDPEQQMAMTGYINLFSQAFRFDCYGGEAGGSYTSAKRLAKAVRDRLFGFLRGEVTSNGESLTIQGIFDDGGEDGLEPPLHGEEQGLDYCAVQVRIWWNE